MIYVAIWEYLAENCGYLLSMAVAVNFVITMTRRLVVARDLADRQMHDFARSSDSACIRRCAYCNSIVSGINDKCRNCGSSIDK